MISYQNESLVDLHSKILDARPSSLLGPDFFMFMQFSGKFDRIVG